jgi:anaerobic selenocysteine-containing dehydrogenase
MSEQNSNSNPNSKLSRRNFLKVAAIATGAAAIAGVPGISKASKVFAAPRIQKGTTVPANLPYFNEGWQQFG